MGRGGKEFEGSGTWSGSHPAFNLRAQTGRALLELCFHGNTVYVIFIRCSTYASRVCKYFFKLFCFSPELTCFWSAHADLKIKANDQYSLKHRFKQMHSLLWKPLERINWHSRGLEKNYPINQRRCRWDVPRNSCLVDFCFLMSAIGIMWCTGNNAICIFDESHLQKSFGHVFFGTVECDGLLYLQRGIQFIFHLSTINDLVLAYLSHQCLCDTVCSLHRALCSLIPRRTCIKPDDCQQAFHGSVLQGPCQRNMLPTQICCSAELFTLWTCCRLHALIEAFESRGLFVSSLQRCLATKWYLLLS